MTHTGGCQCGAVRYRVEGFGEASICHCRMCQKASGNFSIPLAPVEAIDWTRGERTLWASSNRSKRGFCAACGTPLTLETDDGSVEVHIATLDDPTAVHPAYHANTADQIMTPTELGSLPEAKPDRLAENDAWNAAIVSHQHPDHDTPDIEWPR